MVGVALVGVVWKKSRNVIRGNVEEQAEEAREVLMPGGQVGVRDYGAIGGGENGSGVTSPMEESRGRAM